MITTRQKSIAVRTPQWLGDAVVSTIFVKRLREREPDAKITVLSPEALAPLFADCPFVDAVLPLAYPRESVATVAKKIAQEKFDEVFILPRSFRTALEMWLARIPRRVGFVGDLRRFLLTKALAYDSHLLYPQRYLKLIGEEKTPLETLTPYFPASAKVGQEKLEKPLLGLAPASIAPSRTWPAASFAEVANRWLEQQGGTVVLFGSAREKPVTSFIAGQIKGKVVDTAGQLDFPALGAAIRELDLFLTNDSGLMHVASAFSIPTVVVFGASEPATAVPPFGRFIPVQNRQIPCVPCLRNTCVRIGPNYNECLTSIEPREVLKALHAL